MKLFKNIIILLILTSITTGCVTGKNDNYLLNPESGPDTSRVVDSDGNPNFGPK